MEKKKISLSTLFLILAIIAIIVMAVFLVKFYNENTEKTTKCSDLETQVSALNKKLENNNTTNTVTKTNSTISTSNASTQAYKVRLDVNYDLLSAIRGFIVNQEGDNVSGQVKFENNNKVFIGQNVVSGFSGTYTTSDDTVTCNLTSIESENEKTQCNYTIKFKMLHNNVLEVISSDLHEINSNSPIYSAGDLLICYAE